MIGVELSLFEGVNIDARVHMKAIHDAVLLLMMMMLFIEYSI